jgi:hypothetical protein
MKKTLGLSFILIIGVIVAAYSVETKETMNVGKFVKEFKEEQQTSNLTNISANDIGYRDGQIISESESDKGQTIEVFYTNFSDLQKYSEDNKGLLKLNKAVNVANGWKATFTETNNYEDGQIIFESEDNTGKTIEVFFNNFSNLQKYSEDNIGHLKLNKAVNVANGWKATFIGTNG